MSISGKPKQKKCRTCKKEFPPWNSLQVTCSPLCALKQVEVQKAKLVKRDEKVARMALRERRLEIKPKSKWLTETQQPCNAYIRNRDENDGCISCNKPSTWGGQWHASHYRPVGNCSPLRFHPMNIHKSCSECNNFKSGNLSEFRIRLIGKIGLDMVEWLESQNHPYQWDLEDIKDIKIHYKEQLKQLTANKDVG